MDAGYEIYDPSLPLFRYYFDKSLGGGVDSISHGKEENRLELKTFGKFPYVYYAGNTNYTTFELSTVFMYDDENDLSAREQVDRFKQLIDTRRTLFVENSQGQSFRCDVQLIGEGIPKLYVAKDFDYIEIKVKCTQIDI